MKGNKQTLRRRVVVKCAADPMPSCQMGTCEGTKKAAQATHTLNYKEARLWTKPGRKMYDVSQTTQEVVQTADVSVAQQAQATSTSDSSYTVTKTVRNIVTDDTSSTGGVTTSSQQYTTTQVDGYAPASANPYEVPYEEEYTSTTVSY